MEAERTARKRGYKAMFLFGKGLVESAAGELGMSVRTEGASFMVEDEQGGWSYPNTEAGCVEALSDIRSVQREQQTEGTRRS
jgi:hypothetical protein